MTESTTSPDEGLIDRLVTEGLIRMKDAVALYGSATNKSTPLRHAKKGITLSNGTTLRLESVQIGGVLFTTRQAVLRFFKAQQVAPYAPPTPLTPATRGRRAAKASAEVDAILS